MDALVASDQSTSAANILARLCRGSQTTIIKFREEILAERDGAVTQTTDSEEFTNLAKQLWQAAEAAHASRYEPRLLELQESLAAADKQVEALIVDLERSDEKCTSLEAARNKLLEDLAAARAEADTSAKRAAQTAEKLLGLQETTSEEIASLRNQLDAVRSEAQERELSLRAELGKRDEMLHARALEIAKQVAALDAAQKQNDEFLKRITVTEADREASRAEARELSRSLTVTSDAANAAAKRHEEAMTKASSDASAAHEQLAAANKELRRLDRENAALTAQLDQIRAENAALKSSKKTA
jgi:chromosome segregation ATPase